MAKQNLRLESDAFKHSTPTRNNCNKRAMVTQPTLLYSDFAVLTFSASEHVRNTL